MSVVRGFSAVLRKMKRAIADDIARMISVLNQSGPSIPALAVTATGLSETSAATLDPLAWNGFLYAKGLGGAPKHQPGLERRRKKKFNIHRFTPLIRSWHMLIPCKSCGGLKKKHHLCETCYDQTRYETQMVREKLKEDGLDLSQETVLKYKDDDGKFKFGNDKRVFSMERKRPSGWFDKSFWGK